MRIVVETNRWPESKNDAEFCGDCKLYDYDRDICVPFDQILNHRDCRRLRCDECKAAEAYIERCDECNSFAENEGF